MPTERQKALKKAGANHGLSRGNHVVSYVASPDFVSAESEMSTASARTERPSETIMTRGRSVFEFDAGSDDLRGWRTVLDGVMGGRSTGDIAFENGTLVFTGRTSLENNGGFSSIRTNLPERTFADADAIRLVVKGEKSLFEALQSRFGKALAVFRVGTQHLRVVDAVGRICNQPEPRARHRAANQVRPAGRSTPEALDSHRCSQT